MLTRLLRVACLLALLLSLNSCATVTLEHPIECYPKLSQENNDIGVIQNSVFSYILVSVKCDLL